MNQVCTQIADIDFGKIFQILAGEIAPDRGTFRWGLTITHAYFPKERSAYFNGGKNLIQWLLEFAPPTEGESFARAFHDVQRVC